MDRQRVYRVVESIGGAAPEMGFTVASPASKSQKPRQRRWTPKVKTGCITCRIRRVKCDEARPQCKKCITTGRKCDGFEIAPSPPTVCTVTAAAAAPAPNHGLHALTPLYGSATPVEREMFHRFRTATVGQVAGAFYQPFWNAHVLLAAQSEPAIWHASLAMAAMHSWFRMSADGDEDAEEGCSGRLLRQERYRFALGQYNEAIAHLVTLAAHSRGDDAATAEVLLIASVLFTGLSSLRGDPKEAMVHASHGLRVARQWQFVERTESESESGSGSGSGSGSAENASSSSSRSLLPVKSLVGIVDSFEVQYMWTGAREPILKRGAIPRQVPVAPFTSATEACFELQRLVGGLLTAVRREKMRRTANSAATDQQQLPRPVPDLRQPFRHALSAWKVKFSHLKWSQRLRQTDLDCALVLDIWLCGAEIASSLDLSEYELAWDKFTARFRRIVKLAQKLVAEEALRGGNDEQDGEEDNEEQRTKKTKKTKKQGSRPVYSFSASVCEPLFMVGSSCRDGALRRRAIALLRQRPRREGIWDARLLAAVAEAKMKIEESGVASMHDGAACGCVAGAYICNTHRVFFVDIEFLPEHAALVIMKSLHDVSIGSQGRIVTLGY